MNRIRPAARDDRAFVETGDTLAVRTNADGLFPVTTQCADTGHVLMQAWMNLDALSATLETGEAHYYSRSRQELWHKGATSGQVQTVVEARIDCDQDSLLLIVKQAGDGCCHVGHARCFYRTLPVGASVPEDGSVKLSHSE